MNNNKTRLEKKSTSQIFYANETNFFKVQYNNIDSMNGDKVLFNMGGRMNFMINFNLFHKFSQIKSIRLKVKFTTVASVNFNNENSLSTNNGITNGNYVSDNNGYVNIDLMSYCATSQLGTNYFSIVTNDSYLMYQELFEVFCLPNHIQIQPLLVYLLLE